MIRRRKRMQDRQLITGSSKRGIGLDDSWVKDSALAASDRDETPSRSSLAPPAVGWVAACAIVEAPSPPD